MRVVVPALDVWGAASGEASVHQQLVEAAWRQPVCARACAGTRPLLLSVSHRQ